jgi:hypothetical protein
VSTIRFLLDEHIDPRFRRALSLKSPDIVVWRSGDAGAPRRQSTDADILMSYLPLSN